MFYAYRCMRQSLLAEYPEGFSLENPSTIADTISRRKLQEIRLQQDYERGRNEHGYSYATIGNNDFIDKWIDDGVQRGLLTGFWQSDLARFAQMDRGSANRILMDQLNFDEL